MSLTAATAAESSTRRHAAGRRYLIGAGLALLSLLLIVTATVPGTARSAAQPAPAGEAALGEKLFFDTRVSADGSVSCATCHDPAHAFTDARAIAIGIKGATGTRNTPSLLDVARQRSLFWDGRRATLEQQALDPLLNLTEHGFASERDLIDALARTNDYTARFESVYGPGGLAAANVARALAAYQRTLVDQPSPFDRHLAGSAHAMPEPARRGWALFSGRAQCVRCHVAAAPHPLFTDQGFHSLGVGMKAIERQLPQLARRVAALHADGRAQDHSILAEPEIAALGRFVVTLDPADIGKFKTPSLRNVALTAPYMHDGSVATLAEAIELEIYYRGSEDGRPLVLTPLERSDLQAFLEALNGGGP